MVWACRLGCTRRRVVTERCRSTIRYNTAPLCFGVRLMSIKAQYSAAIPHAKKGVKQQKVLYSSENG
jgi:hypothetical protein